MSPAADTSEAPLVWELFRHEPPAPSRDLVTGRTPREHLQALRADTAFQD